MQDLGQRGPCHALGGLRMHDVVITTMPCKPHSHAETAARGVHGQALRARLARQGAACTHKQFDRVARRA